MTREDLKRLRDNLVSLSKKPDYRTTDEIKQVHASMTQANDVIGRLLDQVDRAKGDPVRVEKLSKFFQPSMTGWCLSRRSGDLARQMKGKKFRDAVDCLDV